MRAKAVWSQSNCWSTALEAYDRDGIRPSACCWSYFSETILQESNHLYIRMYYGWLNNGRWATANLHTTWLICRWNEGVVICLFVWLLCEAIASAFLYVDTTTCASIATEPQWNLFNTFGCSSISLVAVHLTATIDNFESQSSSLRMNSKQVQWIA